jgi:phospholipid/cholesterol/gamma-HCH transport system ATP-binding protein
MTTEPVLALEAARAVGEHLPRGALDLLLAEGDFALIEVPGPRRGAGFADLCCGLTPLASGSVRFVGRSWGSIPWAHEAALRGRIGRLFFRGMRPDIPDVASRVLLGRLYHTRIPEAELRAEAAALALRFGLPGLPSGPARFFSEPDLLRAGCVRAFLGEPKLVILELPMAAQADDLLPAVVSLGTEARGRGAAVIWLAAAGPALRNRSIGATYRLRLDDAGLLPVRRLEPGA